jgi:glycosyltransferase involved in cell wall biosynthesis
MLLPGLDHFVPDLLEQLPCLGLEVRAFPVRGNSDLAAACAWADDPNRDVIWFEFCWPPFPAMIAAHDFGGRRVIMRVHRIEAYETSHAANAPWHKIDDVIVVSEHMAMRLQSEVPALAETTALHIVFNGVDVERFVPAGERDAFRIGWCGSLILRKNPSLALEILHLLRQHDRRWHMRLCAKGGERVAIDSFKHLKQRLGLDDAVFFDGDVAAADMPAWHARNAVLLSTSLHESFGYAIAEAASCGCDVAMLDQVGAEEFWPEAMRFRTGVEAAAMIRVARPGKWREMVTERFSLRQQVERLRLLLQPVKCQTDRLRIDPGDALLDVLKCTPASIELAIRPADEMDAAGFLLEAMGYARAGKTAGNFLYRLRN